MKNGIIFGVVSYLLWGLLPLYWKVFDSMGAWEILSQRILWSFISMGMILYGVKRWKDLREVLSEPKSRLGIILASAAITVNWMIYIWAVNADHVVETSLGYYMNPLINILFAVVFLKERLRSLQWIAIGVAALGVILMTIQLGHFPWISIALAISFSCYGLTKKLVKIDSLIGLSGETLVSLPFAMAYLVFIHQQGTDTFLHQPLWVMILMILSGIATAVPLLLFSEATKRISFALVGFIQYLSPTTTLILAIYVFRESFTRAEFMNFSLIWLSLIIYTWGSLSPSKRNRPLKKPLKDIRRSNAGTPCYRSSLIVYVNFSASKTASSNSINLRKGANVDRMSSFFSSKSVSIFPMAQYPLSLSYKRRYI